MSRRYITDLTDGEAVDEIYLVSEKQLRTNRNGNLYLQMRISDRTGSLTTMLWNISQAQYDAVENGDYVRVQGTSQVYNGNMQVLARAVAKSEADSIDESDFVTLSDLKVTELSQRAGELLRGMQDVHLRNLAECFLVDEAFMTSFRSAPAGVKNHHAYRGGLLEHVVSLMELAAVVAPRYPNVNAELLLMGAFLHDIGKITELSYEPDLGYTDSGQLVGHLVQGVQILDGKLRETEQLSNEPFPEPLANRLRHMVVSHHGQLEYGSPKLPMTMEAVVLHYLDNLDAKIHSIQQLIDEDVNKGSVWTVYHPALQRKIYKGTPS